MALRFMRQDDEPKGVTFRGEWIDIDRAYELLESSREDGPGAADRDLFGHQTRTRNRKVREKKVLALAAEMTAGRWYTTGQGLSVDTRGRLIDGQHRLWAIVMSGKPQYMLIAYNVPDEAFVALDEHTKRGFHDVLHIEGETNTVAMAGIVKMILQLHQAVELSRRISVARQTYPNAVLTKAYGQLTQRVDMDDIISVGQRVKSGVPGLPGSAAGAAYYAGVLSYGEAFTDAFFERVVTSLGFTPGDPARTLRKRLAHLQSDPGQRYAETALAYTLKTMQAAHRGEQLNVMRVGNKETFTDWVPKGALPKIKL